MGRLSAAMNELVRYLEIVKQRHDICMKASFRLLERHV
jgi:hypothetical protein